MIYFLLGAIIGMCIGTVTVALATERVNNQKVHSAFWHSKDLISKEFICSECKGLVQLNQYAYNCYYNYCPTCGAKMDEGEENELDRR